MNNERTMNRHREDKMAKGRCEVHLNVTSVVMMVFFAAVSLSPTDRQGSLPPDPG